ncbi:DUF86 domain-containing protein [Rhizobium sp. CC-YZS058]|uniref:HepT-like ribonuclease domain-containing protein n=1 Tax=Rhizobium sp. CC-YZS058 TaxID=3042153 RepID=UPI002B0565F3|nr:HepT-like ribonuclease domain-containing protein [Rhizobium sp. CC-YZS058]MEA3535700.1 HepT-like ribonuclease domain-containing protein [Rhizobium sp. CC-YZS058]
MSSLNAVAHLRIMQEASLQALEYCAPLDRSEFFADKKTYQAVLFNLMLVGESSARILKIDLSFTERFPEIPWRNMKGMRNRIAHAHTTINLATIWATIEQSIPALVDTLPVLIAQARNSNSLS